MSYKALYRTHRPTTFEQVIGQEHIVSTLRNVIQNDKVTHAYLFAGPRGTGKTSVAHVFANILNFPDYNNKTKPRVEAVNNNSMDIIEIDAASNNGVADVRRLIENSKYNPNEAKYKIYIIDEVHMLSKGAFNALLKTLEEPPKHVVFILATTEPHKIPVTILSRTQRFNFRRIKDSDIVAQLESVLDNENIHYSKGSLQMIARLSNGGMRDALSIADQASVFSNREISIEVISQIFGTISTKNQLELISLAYKNKNKELFQLANVFIENGADIQRVTLSLVDLLKDFIIYKKTSDISLLEVLNRNEIDSLDITVDFAYWAMEELVKLLTTLKFSEVPSQSFQLALLKLTSFNDLINVPKPVAQVAPKEVVKEEVIKKVEEPTTQEKTEEVQLEESLDEIFKTAELDVKKENVADEEVKQEVDETGEFRIPRQIMDEQQDTVEKGQIESDILSTQGTSSGESDIAVSQEIDVMSLFSAEGGKKTQSEKKSLENIESSVNEIINLFQQADAKSIEGIKKYWENALNYTSNTKFGKYANLINATKIISAGKGFIVISSNQRLIIKQIIAIRKEEGFLEFMRVLFGEPKLVFPINKDQFGHAKAQWKKLSDEGKLPKPEPIEEIILKKPKATEAEDLGTNIFGDLFNKK